MAENVVGETRFELATLCSQSSKEARVFAASGVERAETTANGINAVAEGCLTDPAGAALPRHPASPPAPSLRRGRQKRRAMHPKLLLSLRRGRRSLNGSCERST